MQLTEASPLSGAIPAFVTRRVDLSNADVLLSGEVAPRAGDLVLASIQSLGHHRRIERVDGRRQHLHAGDLVVLAYGNRYATRQFEARVPRKVEPCDLVAAGGIASEAISWHARVSRGPTRIRPVGILGDTCGRALNLADYALPEPEPGPRNAVRIAVFGSCMDAGKTTTAAFLARGLRNAGARVGFAKLTGTGAGPDAWMLRDAGASPVVDFTDAGFASTWHLGLSELDRIQRILLGYLESAGCDVIVLEVADGLLQAETAALVQSESLRHNVDGVLFASGDPLAAVAGATRLAEARLRVLGISGALTVSPLALRECEEATRLPVFKRGDLADPATAMKLAEAARG